jgi:hypothetical protein
MVNLFTKHPKSIGETYLTHFKCAFKFGFMMIMGGIACVLHSIFPFLFTNTGSNVTIMLAKKFSDRIDKQKK